MFTHTEKCPICNGSGIVSRTTDTQSLSIVHKYDVCHGCDGKGWIEVVDDRKEFPKAIQIV